MITDERINGFAQPHDPLPARHREHGRLCSAGTGAGPERFRLFRSQPLDAARLAEALRHAGRRTGRLRRRRAAVSYTHLQSIGNASFVASFFTVSRPTVVANGNNSLATPAPIAAALVTPPPVDGSYSLALNGAGTLYTLTRQSDGTAWTGASLAALQAAVPVGEGLTLTGSVVAAGALSLIHI